MLRTLLGVIAGFVAWVVLWFGSEMLLSAIWPAFGAQQAAFQAAIETNVPFSAEANFFVTHIVLASIVSVIAGLVAALVAGENRRAPLILGIFLLALGVLKFAMSWQQVPLWYNVIYTAVLLPMTIIGSKFKRMA